MDLSCALLVLVLIVTIAYWFLTCTHNEWKKQNVPFIPNAVPGFGHMLPVVFIKANVTTLVNRLYKASDASMLGFYFMRKPGIIVRDPQLVKSVLQTNFNSFRNNAIGLNKKADPILSKNPFFSTDPQIWKQTRARTTSHLSGKKLKYLSIIIEQVSIKLDSYLHRKIEEYNGTFECELKNLYTRCTGEVVANAAFAIEGQSFEDNPDRFAFTNVVKTIFEPTPINGIKQALLFFVPSIGNFFGISFLEKRADKYFRDTIKSILKNRKQINNAPYDYLQFCLDANDENDIDSVIADIVIFYGDVYETSSTTLAGLFYHLSTNLEIQDKLREHILMQVKQTNGMITYESLKTMTYLEQVIFESMRLTSPLGTMMKVCTEDITLKGSDGVSCHLRPGYPVFIPADSLHHDEKYWPDSQVFDPDRFSPENQSKLTEFTHLPFGGGPRMCIGMRLGMLLVKQVTAILILKYKIKPSTTTILPLQQEPTTFLTHYKGGLWAMFEKLNID